MSVTGSSQDLEDALVDGEERHIEGTAAEIVNDDLAFTFSLVQTVGNGGRCGFVDNSQNVETSDNAGILGSLPLVVVEVGRDGYDGMGDSTSRTLA
jgi:hypothetical protein